MGGGIGAPGFHKREEESGLQGFIIGRRNPGSRVSIMGGGIGSPWFHKLMEESGLQGFKIGWRNK